MSCTETGCGPERQQKETGEQGAEGTGQKNAEENPKGRRKKICRDTLRVRVYRGTNGSLRNPIRDACPCSRMIQPAIRTAAAGNPSGSSMPILMGLMDSCYGDCLRPFQPEVFLCSSGLALPGYGSHSLPAPGVQEECTDGFLNGAYSLHWAGTICSDPETAVP